jgi:hypothetical protein
MSKSIRSPGSKQQRRSVSQLNSNDTWPLFGVVAFLAAVMALFWLLNQSGSTETGDRDIPPFLEAATRLARSQLHEDSRFAPAESDMQKYFKVCRRHRYIRW